MKPATIIHSIIGRTLQTNCYYDDDDDDGTTKWTHKVLTHDPHGIIIASRYTPTNVIIIHNIIIYRYTTYLLTGGSSINHNIGDSKTSTIIFPDTPIVL